MNWKQRSLEAAVWVCGKAAPTLKNIPLHPKSIFILRNNDIGDLLVTTPLFEALRHRFPDTRIVVGVGAWSRAILDNNPYLSEVLVLNAPWYNHSVPRLNAPQALKYIATSPQSKHIAEGKFDIGIDIFGSTLGMLFLIRSGIPYRIGVRGFRGGETASQWCVTYNTAIHVSQANLEIAAHLGATDLPAPRPQLFLSDGERLDAERLWAEIAGNGPRIVLGPGAGKPERCWPEADFASLARRLQSQYDARLLLVGGPGDKDRGAQIAAAFPMVFDRTGKVSLRETFAAISLADLVVCNPSMLMHVAAAFTKHTVVLLGRGQDKEKEQSLWGYPETCLLLGGEDRDSVASPEAAFRACAAWLDSPSSHESPVRLRVNSQ
ncbi:MAG: glycosyltransferase family 9 protein [Cytophagales bacterium]|nr:glycosyltransferase family 9 protein [Armatimonadota bacterium]